MNDNSERPAAQPEATLNRALGSWRQWDVDLAEAPRLREPLPGGKTNESWLIDTSAGRGVIRLNSPHQDVLGIDRYREAVILRAVAAAGLAPVPWFNDFATGFMVTEYLEGRRWQAADLRRVECQRRIRDLIAAFQHLDVGLPRFDYLGQLDHYWSFLQLHGARVPAEVESTWLQWRPLIARLQGQPWHAVLCHHDLTPENLIECGDRLYLLDWEYAGMGHPAMDSCRLDPGISVSPDPVVATICQLMDSLWFLVSEHLDET